MKKFLPAFCVALTLSSACLSFASEEPSQAQESICGKSPQHMWAGIRYTTPRGVGYSQGYTTVEGFFAPQNFLKDAWLPFVDVRGHVFDNGKWAANAGLGVRYLRGSRIFGANTYYDYRNTKHQHYNQVAIGFESLGTVWDFRLNGYLPVGWKHSPLFFPRFAAFTGNQMLIRRSQQFGFSDVNLEAGFHLDHFKKAPLYFAAGPYFLTGSRTTSWGGNLRVRVDLLKYLRIEGNTSYDHFFKWIGQGQLSINIPFGGRSKVMKREGHSCSQEMTLNTRMAQRVDRNEIIPVGQKQVVSTAINPATGLPWHVIFVKNTSASLGTYESPYHALVDAENNSSTNDLIYVFSGDGTTRHMDAGITLQDNQLFFGASTAHQIPTTAGTITIPAQNAILPSITNTSGNVVTLANNNTVSGFSIQVASYNSILGDGVHNATIDQNTFEENDNNAILLENQFSGDLFITNNTFHSFNLSNGLSMVGSGFSINKIIIENNRFEEMSFSTGFLFNLSRSTIQEIQASNNYFNKLSATAAFFINGSNQLQIKKIKINNNIFSNFSESSDGITINVQNTYIDELKIQENYFNQFSEQSSEGIDLRVTNANINECVISNNNFNSSGNVIRGIVVILNNALSLSPINISHNNFEGTGADGWATNVRVNGGTTCLDFTYNNATLGTPAAYRLFQSGGVFGLTPQSNGVLNSGIFSTSGVISSCGE